MLWCLLLLLVLCFGGRGVIEFMGGWGRVVMMVMVSFG